jgi:hypothetical protein
MFIDSPHSRRSDRIQRASCVATEADTGPIRVAESNNSVDFSREDEAEVFEKVFVVRFGKS